MNEENEPNRAAKMEKETKTIPLCTIREQQKNQRKNWRKNENGDGLWQMRF
jgi:hypothetical protein